MGQKNQIDCLELNIAATRSILNSFLDARRGTILREGSLAWSTWLSLSLSLSLSVPLFFSLVAMQRRNKIRFPARQLRRIRRIIPAGISGWKAGRWRAELQVLTDQGFRSVAEMREIGFMTHRRDQARAPREYWIFLRRYTTDESLLFARSLSAEQTMIPNREDTLVSGNRVDVTYYCNVSPLRTARREREREREYVQ